MIRTRILILVLSVLALLQLNSCKHAPGEGSTVVIQKLKDTVKTETDLLLDYLVKTGDYVNSRQFPSMIKAPTVFENLDKNMLVVDLRDKNSFSKGHIKGAVNVKFANLPDYFQKDIKPFKYDKIVLVCDHGQQSGYATCLLRLMGYGNVYSMRWGMVAWNPALAKERGWDKLVSDKYSAKLDTITISRHSQGLYPVLKTGKKTGEEILAERIKVLFGENLKDIMLTADQVFDKKDSMYIINYDRKDKYESGHIPGSVRYKPNGTLGIASEMLTIPASKDVVVYCETGHNSAFATAYLRLLGYNAHSLRLGGNSFMYGKMKQEKSLVWSVFSDEQMNNFPAVK